MILNALVDYYEALVKQKRISAVGWCQEKVSFALDISLEGELLAVIPLKREEERGNKTISIPETMKVPVRVVRSSGISPNFLCDNSSYFLGINKKGKESRAINCFLASKEYHTSILEDNESNSGKAVKAFYEKWNPEKARDNRVLQPYIAEITGGVNLVFRIHSKNYAQEEASIQKMWYKRSTQSRRFQSVRCLVTGEMDMPARLHGKIKGIPGAKSVGASLVSYNAPSFHSYGKESEKEIDVPVGEYAAFAYVTAINTLLGDKEHCHHMGDTMVVYWSEKGNREPQDLMSLVMTHFLEQGDVDSILNDVFEKLTRGEKIEAFDWNETFYILGLAPNAARISVRFFLQNTIGQFFRNLQDHFERLRIVRAPFEKEYLSIHTLLKQTVNPNSRDKSASPLMTGAVLRAILNGTSYPRSFYQSVIRRVYTEQDDSGKGLKKITRGRAAIIKACLTWYIEGQEKEVLTVALNEQSNNRAYVLGRLFSILEKAQDQANPGMNTTIKDRYFTSASTSPASVFPRLLQLSNFHIAKSKEKGKWIEKDIQNLLGKLEVDKTPFPSYMTLNEQGLFILGYYHETQSRYEKKKGEE